ncbi:hypothetical protein [Cupriavidus sp. UYPR2.512]|uniref:hypothetical protein n=1 Tax=Cupriavidus sp. UYPR2.512 TaxID=1080187 RepID=UPI0003A468B2|nr:hypothetical protein [Cupriavidus sp. UYPR2.512]
MKDAPGSGSYPGRYWHFLDDGRMQCDLCPRHCRLHGEQRGACFVRQRMALTAYGRSSGFCIDPVEKEPLNHFYPGSAVLGGGGFLCTSWNRPACRRGALRRWSLGPTSWKDEEQKKSPTCRGRV